MPRRKNILYEIERDALRNLVSIVTLALTLASALFWVNVIQTYIKETVATSQQLLAQVYAGIILTLIALVGLVVISRISPSKK